MAEEKKSLWEFLKSKWLEYIITAIIIFIFGFFSTSITNSFNKTADLSQAITRIEAKVDAIQTHQSEIGAHMGLTDSELDQLHDDVLVLKTLMAEVKGKIK